MINILFNKSDRNIYHQGQYYFLKSNKIDVKDSLNNPLFEFGTLNSNICDVAEIEDLIPDFHGNKYIYTVEGNIELNPQYQVD